MTSALQPLRSSSTKPSSLPGIRPTYVGLLLAIVRSAYSLSEVDSRSNKLLKQLSLAGLGSFTRVDDLDVNRNASLSSLRDLSHLESDRTLPGGRAVHVEVLDLFSGPRSSAQKLQAR